MEPVPFYFLTVEAGGPFADPLGTVAEDFPELVLDPAAALEEPSPN